MAKQEERSSAVDKSGWHAYIDDFVRDAFPLFAEHGIPKGEALIVWEMNRIQNELRHIKDILEEELD